MPGFRGIEKIEVRRGELEIDTKVEPFLRIPLEIEGAAQVPFNSPTSEALQGFLAIGERGNNPRIGIPIAAAALVSFPHEAEVREVQPSRSQSPGEFKDAGGGSGMNAIELGFAMIVGMAFMGRGKGKKPTGPEKKNQELEKINSSPGVLKKLSGEFDHHDKPFLVVTGAGVVTGLLSLLSLIPLTPWIPVAAVAYGLFPLLGRRQRLLRIFEENAASLPLQGEMAGADWLDAAGYEAARKLRGMASDSVLSAPERKDYLEKLGGYLRRMHPDHPERRQLSKFLLSMVRDPWVMSYAGMGLDEILSKTHERDWAWQTLQWSQALRLTALNAYLEVMREPPNTLELMPNFVKTLRQTIDSPRWPVLGQILVRFKEGAEYLKVFENNFRTAMLKVYLGSLPYLPRDHPEVLAALRLVRTKSVLDLARMSTRMKLSVWGVLSLAVSDKAELDETRRVLEKNIKF